MQVHFYIAVNETFTTCYAGGLSGAVPPNLTLREGPIVAAGTCDSGPLVYSITAEGLLVTFGSGVIADASPPQCVIAWADSKQQSLALALPRAFGMSPALPDCSVMDSREGYHMTQYTFAALAWE